MVIRWYRAWTEEHSHERRHSTGPQRRTTESQDRFLRLAAVRGRSTSTRRIANAWYDVVGRPISMSSNIDDNGSNGAVTEITEIMNGIQLCSAMNSDFDWGPTMDYKGSEDILCSILWNVIWSAL
ncbi:hypothetical protein BDFB_007765, partial [Asbolus verrucosus]